MEAPDNEHIDLNYRRRDETAEEMIVHPPS